MELFIETTFPFSTPAGRGALRVSGRVHHNHPPTPTATTATPTSTTNSTRAPLRPRRRRPPAATGTTDPPPPPAEAATPPSPPTRRNVIGQAPPHHQEPGTRTTIPPHKHQKNPHRTPPSAPTHTTDDDNRPTVIGADNDHGLVRITRADYEKHVNRTDIGETSRRNRPMRSRGVPTPSSARQPDTGAAAPAARAPGRHHRRQESPSPHRDTPGSKLILTLYV